MHQNIYNHEKNESGYRHYISNIAYRFKFDVIYEEECIMKVENGKTTLITSTEETPRNTLSWKAWLKLMDEYEYSGMRTE